MPGALINNSTKLPVWLFILKCILGVGLCYCIYLKWPQYPFNWATTLQGQVPGLGGSIASLFGGTTQPSNYFATPSGAGVFNGTVLGTGGLQTPTPTGTH